MTNHKDSEDEDWEFHVNPPEVKYAEEVKDTHRITKRQNNLALDEAAVPRTKTRSAMALEMENTKDDELADVYSFAPLPKRAVAFVLDAVFLYAIISSARFTAPFWRMLIQYFMDHYKLKFLVAEPVILNTIMGLSVFLGLFFLTVIPVAFFNTSFGKKILGLRVRGIEKYTVSISDAFKRELIMKPLSIVIIAGFITPFISKKRLSIHDMLTHTFVIEE